MKTRIPRFTVCLTAERIGYSIATDTGGREAVVYYQSDWDFPALARSLGWSGKIRREKCSHGATDGTVDCPDCGAAASQFIAAAAAWLDSHCGLLRLPVTTWDHFPWGGDNA